MPLDAAGSPEFAARVIEDVRPRMVVGDLHLLAALGFEVRGSRFEEERGQERGETPREVEGMRGSSGSFDSALTRSARMAGRWRA